MVTPALTPIWRELRHAPGLLRGTAGAVAGRPVAGASVLLIPGFLSGDRSLAPLSLHLAGAGHRPCFAGISRNVDCAEATCERILRAIETAARDAGRIALVGHSRGGMMARALARRRPDLVSGVVTLCAPSTQPFPAHPLLWLPGLALAGGSALGRRGLARYSCWFGACCAAFRADVAGPLPSEIGFLSVYSRADGILDWRSCLDPGGRHVEVDAGHCGMASHPLAAQRVARALTAFAR